MLKEERKVEWLVEETAHSQAFRPFFVLERTRGCHDDGVRRALPLAEVGEKIEAVSVRELHVEKERFEMGPCKLVESLGATPRRCDLVSLPRE